MFFLRLGKTLDRQGLCLTFIGFLKITPKDLDKTLIIFLFLIPAK
jgi:hypothetical protein